MLIAVISDSHGNKTSISKIKKKISNAEVLLFLGDGENDLKEITKDFTGEVYAVRGNCDFEGKYPEERIIEIRGKKIFMCHGHRYGVKYGYNSIYYRGKEVGADIVLFGHSHLPIIEECDGLTLMNPGSISHGMGKIDKTLGYIDLINNKAPIMYIKEL
ncbi:metallophosphoesterase [Clostridium sp. D53t1_180928_C8]|uniref:YfcE family phosphodiesterase n=1 Tax=Clostridium sp. D53t1_180928_C8 TaxID=2787101 RepID=UPI0018A92A55